MVPFLVSHHEPIPVLVQYINMQLWLHVYFTHSLKVSLFYKHISNIMLNLNLSLHQ